MPHGALVAASSALPFHEGRLRRTSSGDNVDGTTNFLPRMPAAPLVAGYRSTLRRIYAPAAYDERVRTFFREYRQPRICAPIEWQHLFALGFSTIRLGLIGRERLHYWRLLTRTLLHRPALFQLAGMVAIYGHHFRRCCEAITEHG